METQIEEQRQIIINTAWEKHIREFFTTRLPGNESNFNFTEILANFPFLLEWIIQNRPKYPAKVKIWYFGMDLCSKRVNTYDLDYITAHPNATPELIIKYPEFEWSVPVIKYKFQDDPHALEALAPLLQDPKHVNSKIMDKYDYNKIIYFNPAASPIDIPNKKIDEKYIPALLASGGDLDYVCYPPGYDPETYKQQLELKLEQKKQNPFLCDVAFIDGQCVEVINLNCTFKIRQFVSDIWDYCSFSPLVPWEFIDKNRKLPWNWKLVFRSPRFAPDFFMTPEGEQQAWDGDIISGYRRLTFELIEYLERKRYKLDWTSISYCDFREEKARFFQSYVC